MRPSTIKELLILTSLADNEETGDIGHLLHKAEGSVVLGGPALTVDELPQLVPAIGRVLGDDLVVILGYGGAHGWSCGCGTGVGKAGLNNYA